MDRETRTIVARNRLSWISATLVPVLGILGIFCSNGRITLNDFILMVISVGGLWIAAIIIAMIWILFAPAKQLKSV